MTQTNHNRFSKQAIDLLVNETFKKHHVELESSKLTESDKAMISKLVENLKQNVAEIQQSMENGK